ncbi:serine recombinase [Anaerocolumna cellulosilytica]|uniref:Serine recombinase n=1 Tax=Anaerocolumna cellulosilytica TaxID=433286 RepID=A0A6S6RB17_9FIRM|nr:recombinase family protein [Anaerocolumna cellulosilytica]MBB5195207.1 DNA invertase Pin-like site-specific DNA recombinase [Anaerocolumna cellulosilytica]BCJ96680.1 serine recombinase [Anaerocolumna cellulosilytica]
MKAVAYCRVSTSKEEQLDSLDSQQRFFREYADRNSLDLVGMYADEGKSGTKMRNRTQLIKLLKDAGQSLFEVVLIKDVSRLARNTVDFLTSIRSLKLLNIKVIFVNYDQTSSDSSEFMLTMLSAIAQEESANTSKRVRFGKRQNAVQGRVPNLIYGYDKTPGEYFQLAINQEEAKVIRRIFHMYTEKMLGASRIAALLNKEGLVTKRGCLWSQVAVSRILANEIYIGRIINGKEEIEDFLTGKRKAVDRDNWLIKENADLKIVDERVFCKAESLLKERKKSLKIGKNVTGKHTFSQLMRCKECGSSYRRLVRTYRNTRITWVCMGHNGKGKEFCKNAASIEEEYLVNRIRDYFLESLNDNSYQMQQMVREYKKLIMNGDSITVREQEYQKVLIEVEKQKEKYITLYTNDIITLAELKERTIVIDAKKEQCLMELKMLMQEKQSKDNMPDKGKLNQLIEIALSGRIRSNDVLSKLLNRIEVDGEGNVDIYLEVYS